MTRRVVLAVALATLAAAVAPALAQDAQLVYVGTYTGAKSKGIHAFRFDAGTGALTPIGLVAETRSPSWLVVHPSGRYLYAANEVDDIGADKSGSVSAYAIDRATGALTALNVQSSKGAHPCHLAVDRSGSHLLVANYSGGNIAVLPIASDGRLAPASQVIAHSGSGVNASRQGSPHAHSVDFDATGRFAIASDLGADRLFVYRYDPTTGLSRARQPAIAASPGAGPRHFAFHPNGRLGFGINEMAMTVTSYAWDASRGALTTLSTVPTLPRAVRNGDSTAEIRVHPSGRFVYGSNRGHDSIAVYRVAPATGLLTLVEHELTRGRTPRSFTIDPGGRWLVAANQDSDTLAVFRIDKRTGALTPAGGLVPVGAPVAVVFVDLRG
jgi:6-phosphogluconolactonase